MLCWVLIAIIKDQKCVIKGTIWKNTVQKRFFVNKVDNASSCKCFFYFASIQSLVKKGDFLLQITRSSILSLVKKGDFLCCKSQEDLTYTMHILIPTLYCTFYNRNDFGTTWALIWFWSKWLLFSYLFRSFNDAINGFTEDGWILMNPGVPGDLIVSIRRHANFENSANYHNIFCVKSSVLLQVSYKSNLIFPLNMTRNIVCYLGCNDYYMASPYFVLHMH